MDVTYTYDINSLLEVEVTVVSTGESRKMIIKGQDNQMTEEEVRKRMYEEALGERRKKLDRYITAFEAALKKDDHDGIREAREALAEVLEEGDEWE